MLQNMNSNYGGTEKNVYRGFGRSAISKESI